MNQSSIQRYITEGFASIDSFDANAIKQIGSLACASMNAVDCSLAPNCSQLNRYGCLKTSHTCGECLNRYVGTDEDSNDPCSVITKNRRLCAVSLDCSSDRICSNGVCLFGFVIVSKELFRKLFQSW